MNLFMAVQDRLKKKKGNHGKKKTCKKDNALLTELFQVPAKLVDLYPYFHVSGLHYKNRQSGQRWGNRKVCYGEISETNRETHKEKGLMNGHRWQTWWLRKDFLGCAIASYLFSFCRKVAAYLCYDLTAWKGRSQFVIIYSSVLISFSYICTELFPK